MINLPPYPKHSDVSWKGMTLEEMQMRRALVQARMEIQKFKLTAQIDSARRGSPLFGGERSLFSRVTGVFSIAEYAFMAIKLFRLAAPLFRRKK